MCENAFNVSHGLKPQAASSQCSISWALWGSAVFLDRCCGVMSQIEVPRDVYAQEFTVYTTSLLMWGGTRFVSGFLQKSRIIYFIFLWRSVSYCAPNTTLRVSAPHPCILSHPLQGWVWLQLYRQWTWWCYWMSAQVCNHVFTDSKKLDSAHSHVGCWCWEWWSWS